VNTYPYGNTYQERYCNGFDYWGDLNGTTMPVAMLSKCQTSRSGYCAVYDLSGNVYEWEDSCYDTIHLDLSGNAIKGSPACYVRGGAFDSYGMSGYSGIFSEGMKCREGGADRRAATEPDVGFRCCSP